MGKSEVPTTDVTRKRSGCIPGCLLVFLGAIVLSIASVVIFGPPPPSAPTAKQVASQPTPTRPRPRPVATAPSPNPPDIGDTVRLVLPGADGIFVSNAEDEKAWDDMTAALLAKDDDGLSRMMARGRVFYVPPGTRARLLEIAVFSRKVRILGGDYSGQSGWVAQECVVAQ
jgi:hypothetical protein